MKAFVAITLLAACVAAQNFDLHHSGLRSQLLKRQLVSGLYNGLNKDYTLRDVVGDVVPTDYNTMSIDNVNTLTFEQIIRHPLFATYYNIPLFRQHFSHPLFRVYLTTPYFQNFWTHPIFPTFFRSSHLFNKYILPVVYNTQSVVSGEYDFGHNTQNVFGGDYKTQTVYPHVQYNHIINKIIKSLLVNKPENTVEVITDVKVHKEIPVVEETLGKYVEPITHDLKYTVGDYKNVVDRYTPVDILKKIWLNKVLYGDRTVDRVIPEIYNTNRYQHSYRDLINNVVPQSVYQRDLIDSVVPRSVFNKYDILNKYESVVPRDLVRKYESVYPRDLVNTLKYGKHYETVLPREFVDRVETVLPRDLLNKVEIENKLENILLNKQIVA